MANLTVTLDSGCSLPCALVRSARAKYVRLKLSPKGELTLVVPHKRSLSAADAHTVLRDMVPWIERALRRVEARAQLLPQPVPLEIPASICLPGLGESWQVYCVPVLPGLALKAEAKVRVKAEQGRLLLQGNVDNIPACCRALQKWLMAHVREWLVRLVFTMAARHGFNVCKVCVRGQRTRWGSCSVRGIVNINYRLALLETRIVEHLILHELCHLTHMNHSAQYKKYLQSFEPQWQHFERELDRAWRHLPPWIVEK